MAMSKYQLFLTGQPGIGKSTIVRRLNERLLSLGFETGGMLSGELREGGFRVGFEILDVKSGKKGILAHVRHPHGPRVGRYTVNLDDLASIGANAILTAVSDCQVVFIDEIGPMELKSEEFKAATVRALESPRPLIGTIHRNASDPLVQRIKFDRATKLVELTFNNRDALGAQLERELSELKKD